MSKLADRIIANQKQHHELCRDYFAASEKLRLCNSERLVLIEEIDALAIQIHGVEGAMNFVSETRAEMRAEKKSEEDAE